MRGPLQLEITRPSKPPVNFPIEPGVYTIGGDDDCRIHLPDAQVSPRHAILTVDPSQSWIEDLDSDTGTRIDGRPVDGRAALPHGEAASIGPFVLRLSYAGAPPPPESSLPPREPEPAPSIAETRAGDAGADVDIEQRRKIRHQIHQELVERLDLKRLTASRVNKEELRARAIETIEHIVSEVSARLPPGLSAEALTKEVCDEALGLGPLEDFLADPDITEIMVNGPNHIYYEKDGKLTRSPQTFMNDDSVLAIIERIVSPIGRRIDESQPYVDARLPDGSRVNAIIHPLSLVGPCLTIRKFSKHPFTDADLVGFGTLTPDIAAFIEVCIKLRKNIVVSGGTGSGKTTLLNVLSGYLPPTDRIVTIEDAAELRLPQEHVVRLEARPPNIEGKGAVTIRDLVRNALRMRPDRIVVGECRGGEALDMLQAMNTGHDGSLTTIHANSPRDVISRMETMVLMSGMELPIRAIREQVAAAVDLIVHIARHSDGSRKVTRVTEIVGLEGTQVTMQDIFEFTQTGLNEEGHVLGGFRPTGAIPTFLEEIGARGLSVDHAIFDPQRESRDS